MAQSRQERRWPFTVGGRATKKVLDYAGRFTSESACFARDDIVWKRSLAVWLAVKGVSGIALRHDAAGVVGQRLSLGQQIERLDDLRIGFRAHL